MFSKKKSASIKSVIAEGTRIEGHLSFSGGLHIDGEVVGDIRVDPQQPSLLIISESGRVSGTVYANHVIINGRVCGPVHATELLELQPKAQIEGDVFYKTLEMHSGALISGKLQPLGLADGQFLASNLLLAEQVEEKPTLKLTSKNN